MGRSQHALPDGLDGDRDTVRLPDSFLTAVITAVASFVPISVALIWLGSRPPGWSLCERSVLAEVPLHPPPQRVGHEVRLFTHVPAVALEK
jgi:hypothetical protein